MSAPLRVAIVGATGALGSEVVEVLAESSADVAELWPVATDRSLGQDLAFRGEEVPVETTLPPEGSLDLLFLCTPAGACLDLARRALREGIPCVDATGTLAAGDGAPLAVAALAPPPSAEAAPLVVSPPGAALAWALALAPLARAAGPLRVVGTALEAASWGGRQGIESLYQESIALFNQEEPPVPAVFAGPVAFDCIPALGDVLPGGETEREASLAATVARLLGDGTRVGATRLQVPAFVGFGSSLAVETSRALDPKQAQDALAGAAGVELWRGEPGGLTLRAAANRERVIVGRVRRDPAHESGLLLWLASDVLRLAAANAVAVAIARLRRAH